LGSKATDGLRPTNALTFENNENYFLPFFGWERIINFERNNTESYKKVSNYNTKVFYYNENNENYFLPFAGWERIINVERNNTESY